MTCIDTGQIWKGILRKNCQVEEISTVTQNSICYIFQVNAANLA